MHRRISLAALPASAAMVLAGCGAGAEDASSDAPTSSESASHSSSPSPSPSPTEAALEAADGTDYESCHDGDCEVIVSEGVSFALDPAFGIDTFTVLAFDTFTPEGGGTPVDRVKFEATGSGYLSMTLPVDGNGKLQGTLWVRVKAIGDGEAVLVLEPV